MALWTPSNLDLAQVWLKGGTGVAGKTNVSSWDNQIADVTNGSSFGQTVSSKRPTFGTALNGIDAIEFDGTNDFLEAGDVSTLDSLGTFMMAAVIRPTLDTNARAILSKGTAGLDGSFSWRITGTGNSSKLSFVIFSADNDPNSIAFESATNPFSGATDNICLAYRTSTTARHRVNGADNGVASGVSFLNEASGDVSSNAVLGEFEGGGCEPFDGLIYEVVVVSATTLSATPFSNLEDIDSVEGYLAHRYALNANLPATHKYSEFAPAFGLHGVHNQDLAGELALDVLGPLVSDTLAGVV
tara:strand:- start:251 stop:1150 length:900 start_codon:yes stop_codon:yes gene_type:complete